MSDIPSEEYLKEISLDEDYDYVVIRFKHKGPLKKLEDIDLVPTDWLYFNENKSLICPFLKSMENKNDVKLLRHLVKTSGPVHPDWPPYSVQAIGRAHTYQEGLAKIEKSKTNPTVFMTDSEGGNVEAEKAVIRQIKRKKLLDECENLKKKFKKSTESGPSPPVKQTKPRKTAHSNDSTRKLSSKSKKTTIKPSDGNNNATHENDTSILPNMDVVEQSNSVPSTTDTIESDASQSHSSCVDDGTGTDKENTSEKSTEISDSDSQTVPVMDISEVECTSKFEKAVMFLLLNLSNRLGVLEKEIKDLSKHQKDQKTSKKSGSGDFGNKYGIQLPIRTKEAFVKFNENLVENESLRKDLYTEFKSFLNDDCKITVIMGLILRRFLSKEVLSHYTAIKGSSSSTETDTGAQTDEADNAEKDSFEPLQFCKCMYGFIRVSRKKKLQKDCSDQELRKALSSVFSNAKKWKSTSP